MRISDWSSDVCSSDLRSSNSLLEVGALSQTMIETDFSRLIEPTRINSRLYTDPAIFAGEMEKIWYRTWVYVGHEREVPEMNDYVTKIMDTTPIIMVREREGHLRLLLNKCQHRGNPQRGRAACR